MSVQDDQLYHAARARAELEAAYRARRPEIAAVRLELCSLHLQRARATLGDATAAAAAELDWLERCAPLHGKCLQSA